MDNADIPDVSLAAVPVPVKKKRTAPEAFRKCGFVKGDPRINRNGRPRKSDELRKCLLEKFDQIAVDKNGEPVLRDGHPITNLDLMFERMFRDPRSYKELLDRAFGKVRDEVEINGTMSHTAASIDIGSLDLDRETQRKVLDAIRKRSVNE